MPWEAPRQTWASNYTCLMCPQTLNLSIPSGKEEQEGYSVGRAAERLLLPYCIIRARARTRTCLTCSFYSLYGIQRGSEVNQLPDIFMRSGREDGHRRSLGGSESSSATQNQHSENSRSATAREIEIPYLMSLHGYFIWVDAGMKSQRPAFDCLLPWFPPSSPHQLVYCFM